MNYRDDEWKPGSVDYELFWWGYDTGIEVLENGALVIQITINNTTRKTEMNVMRMISNITQNTVKKIVNSVSGGTLRI